MIKRMDSEFILEQVENRVTRENGEMISNTEKAGKYGKMEVSILGLMQTQRKRGLACTYGLMVTDTWEDGKITRFMEIWGSTNGKMAGLIVEVGRIM